MKETSKFEEEAEHIKKHHPFAPYQPLHSENRTSCQLTNKYISVCIFTYLEKKNTHFHMVNHHALNGDKEVVICCSYDLCEVICYNEVAEIFFHEDYNSYKKN